MSPSIVSTSPAQGCYERRRSSGTTVVTKAHLTKEDAVNLFVARYASLVTSTLSGFDRLVFRGTLGAAGP